MLIVLLALCTVGQVCCAPNFLRYVDFRGQGYDASYTARAITLNGTPSLFVSGSVHYPRSTPAQWPRIMQRARDGGLNMIEVTTPSSSQPPSHIAT